MALLDLQGMETTGGGTDGDSELSVLLCGPVKSNLSVTLCL